MSEWVAPAPSPLWRLACALLPAPPPASPLVFEPGGASGQSNDRFRLLFREKARIRDKIRSSANPAHHSLVSLAQVLTAAQATMFLLRSHKRL